MAFFTTSKAEAPLGAFRQNQRLLTTKWCVLDGVKVVEDGGLALVVSTKGLIAFHFLVSRSFMQFLGPCYIFTFLLGTASKMYPRTIV
jgi:hypothetical protein